MAFRKLGLAIGIGVVLGCSPTNRSRSGARGGTDTTAHPAEPSADSGKTRGNVPLLAAGDTFDLRVAGVIALGSPEARAAGCSTRPPISEELIIADTAFYSVFRVVEEGCGSVGVDTQQLEGTFRLSRDTIQFYRGGGNEVELGYRGVVSADTLLVFSGTPLGTLTFTRRTRPANWK